MRDGATNLNRRTDWDALLPWLGVGLLLGGGALLVAFLWRSPIIPTAASEPAVSLAPRPPSEPAGPDPATPSAPPPTADATTASPARAEPQASTARRTRQAGVVREPAPIPPLPTPEPANSEAETPAPVSRYTNRTGRDRGRALDGFGGGEKTETAVRLALDWLAAHQRADGAWDRVAFNVNCPEDDVCREVGLELTKFSAEPAVTGLALLAYLGAGHTDRTGDYQPTVSRGLAYLLVNQHSDGAFADVNTLEMYNHAIATMALAEAFAMTGEPLLRKPLEAAVAHIVRAQQPGGGWGYTSTVGKDRNDMSVTGWVTMALAGADGAGIRAPDETILGILDFVTEATLPDGQVYYAREGSRLIHNALGAKEPLYSPATTAIGMLVRQLLGVRPDAPVLQQQQSFLLAQPPDVHLRKGGDKSEFHSDYYWYYGTLALFNQGGDAWESWNDRLLDALMSCQDRVTQPQGPRRHTFGSFTAFGPGWGKWGRAGGRVYATALAALMLESYYRYVPTYLSSAGLIRESTLRAGLARDDAGRVNIVHVASLLSPDVGEPLHVELLRDPDGAVRLRAAMGLARHGSPMGEGVLKAALAGTTGGERHAVQTAIERLAKVQWPQHYGTIVRADPGRGVLVFETVGRPLYAGMTVQVERDGRVIARGAVTRRVTDHGLAAARIDAAPPGEVLRLGDTVGRAQPAPPP